eukprot:6210028-Pleurochrysis_carterae.AAC.11
MLKKKPAYADTGPCVRLSPEARGGAAYTPCIYASVQGCSMSAQISALRRGTGARAECHAIGYEHHFRSETSFWATVGSSSFKVPPTHLHRSLQST